MQFECRLPIIHLKITFRIVECLLPTSGISGSHLKDALLSRTRTESERIEEADWTNSPIMKLKNTPVLDDVRPTKEVSNTKVTCNGSGDHKRPTKMRLSKTALKSRLDACDDDRDSTTTPDSTKDAASRLAHKNI